MSQNIQEAVERGRRLLYSRLTDEQLVMAALFYLLTESAPSRHEAMKLELLGRFQNRKNEDLLLKELVQFTEKVHLNALSELYQPRAELSDKAEELIAKIRQSPALRGFIEDDPNA